MIHSQHQNRPSPIVDDRNDASQMIALRLELRGRHHLLRSRQGEHLLFRQLGRSWS
jgi:hypothetical protein